MSNIDYPGSQLLELGEISQTAKKLSQSVDLLAGGVAAVCDEVILLRKQMAASSETAAKHELALVGWSRILTVATIVYTILTAGLLVVGVWALLRAS